MAIYRCKMCGGDLEVQEGASSCTCEFCGTQQTIPTVKDEGLQTLFNRANVLRMKSEFDRAAEVYEKILQKNDKEAEAYWGLILCKYGIEYVEDPESVFQRAIVLHMTQLSVMKIIKMQLLVQMLFNVKFMKQKQLKSIKFNAEL